MRNNGFVEGVLLIYTGGTIGSVRKDASDPFSPLVPGHIDQILNALPHYQTKNKKIFFKDKVVKLDAIAFEKPLDSANIIAKDWAIMADLVKKNYEKYEGFVILHGTDTMAYTASALAFMVENLGKPIVLTGAQLPIGETRSDAVQNVVTAIEFAAARTLGHPVVPEVTVLFANKLYRGCRLRKISTSSYKGFGSPNLPALGNAGEHIRVRTELIRPKQKKSSCLHIVKMLDMHIMSLDIFPGIDPEILRSIFSTKGLKGVILKTFGTGNAPTTKNFLEAIDFAVREKNLLIVNVTQCLQGEVEQGLYDASSGLMSAGVISGLDITPEAAFTKMMVVLSKGLTGGKRAEADMLQHNLRGEQRASTYTIHFQPQQVKNSAPLTWPVALKGKKKLVFTQDGDILQNPQQPYNQKSLQKAFLRIFGIQITSGQQGNFDCKIYLGESKATQNVPKKGSIYLGTISKKLTAKTNLIILDITSFASQCIDITNNIELTLVSLGGSDITIQNTHIALMTQN